MKRGRGNTSSRTHSATKWSHSWVRLHLFCEFLLLLTLKIALTKNEVVEGMRAPKNKWGWVNGELTHIDLSAKLKNDLQYIIDAYEGEGTVSANYFDNDPQEPWTDWEDYAFHWLTLDQEAAFHIRGPNTATRSECICFFKLLLASGII
jgi:hypothetical protein